MYEQYYKLRKKPFEMSPDPAFLYLSGTHRKALSYLNYGLKERATFILLTGEVGSGKTTLLSAFRSKLAYKEKTALICNTRLNAVELLTMVNENFGVPSANRNKAHLIKDLHNALLGNRNAGATSVLIIDEAQNLSQDVLEEIRMLSNLEADARSLLQIILVGQPELNRQLGRPELRQMRQRISVNCTLTPMGGDETTAYIRHRLAHAGNADAVHFEADALEQIYRSSRGIPRVINLICDFLLLAAYTEQASRIDREMVSDIVEDLDVERMFAVPAEARRTKGIDYGALMSALGVSVDPNQAHQKS